MSRAVFEPTHYKSDMLASWDAWLYMCFPTNLYHIGRNLFDAKPFFLKISTECRCKKGVLIQITESHDNKQPFIWKGSFIKLVLSVDERLNVHMH